MKNEELRNEVRRPEEKPIIELRFEKQSLAIIRSVSLRLQNEGQKNAHGSHRCTRSLWHGFFLTFSFRCKRIINGFASVNACGCREVNSLTSKKKLFLFFYPHTLTFRLKRPVYRGFNGEGKCEGKISPLTFALTPKSVSNPICPVKAQSKSKENQKTNPCKDSVINLW